MEKTELRRIVTNHMLRFNLDTLPVLNDPLWREAFLSLDMLPALNDAVWLEAFQDAPDSVKQHLANTWLQKVDNDCRKQSSAFTRVLSDCFIYISQIKPYVVAREVKNCTFDGSTKGLFDYYDSNLDEHNLKILKKYVTGLLFGSDNAKKTALLKLPKFIDEECNDGASLPKWGSFLGNLAWYTIEQLNLKGNHVEGAARISMDAALEDVKLNSADHSNHHTWHYLMYYMYRVDLFKQLRGLKDPDASASKVAYLLQTINKLPAGAAARSLVELLSFKQYVSEETNLDKPLPKDMLLTVMHPEDKTVLDILNRWVPKAAAAWALSISLGYNLKEALDVASDIHGAEPEMLKGLELPTDITL